MDLNDLWRRLERWAAENAPVMLDGLNHPASDLQIEELEGKIGQRLPACFRDSLKIHNGQSDGWPPERIFSEYGEYLSTDQIYETWKSLQEILESLELEPEELEMSEVIGPVRPASFDAEWVPFSQSNGDIFWALDFNPTSGGVPGQVIEIYWEGGVNRVLFSSFAEFLLHYVTELENGAYPYRSLGVPSKFRQ